MADNQHPDINFSNLFHFVVKKAGMLAIIAIVAAILSSVVALLMTEYFSASAIIFPARTNSVALNDYSIRRGNISDFGDEEEAEQLLQIINAVTLQERVIRSNNLYDHYDIDPNMEHARSEMFEAYNDQISARRTKFNSIEIKVVDKVPEVAAKIANDIVDFIDTVKNSIIAQRAEASLGSVNDVYQNSESQLADIMHRMDSLHRLGVATEQERAAIYRAYGEALANGNRSASQQLKEQIDINKKHGDEYDVLKRQRDLISDQAMRHKSFREQFLNDAQSSIAQKFIVDRAAVPDKKSHPIRWLIVVGSVGLSCLFALILLLMKERNFFSS